MIYKSDLPRSADVGIGATVAVISERWVSVPGVITHLGVGIQDSNQWANGFFQLRINGMIVRDYGMITDQIGRFDDPTPVEVFVPPGALIEMLGTNNNAAQAKMAARLKIEEIPRVAGERGGRWFAR